MSSIVLKHLRKQRIAGYADLSRLAKRQIKGGDVLFIPAIDLLYMLGLVEYRRKVDSFEYIWTTMKISKLYTNRPRIFELIVFGEELNVVMAEIRNPANKDRDTHNLGKTTIGTVLDFTLLSGRDRTMFLFKYPQFEDFIFFIEIFLSSGGYLTVRRSVEEASKVSFKRHMDADQDLNELGDDEWDHFQVSFDRARVILDGYLDLQDLKPWSFRKGLGYILRTQADYADVFQLNRFRAAHSDWKPFIAHILGFDSEVIVECYAKEDSLDDLRNEVAILEAQAGGTISDLGKIDGMLSLKRREATRTARVSAKSCFMRSAVV